jgi:hypothetical protein
MPATPSLRSRATRRGLAVLLAAALSGVVSSTAHASVSPLPGGRMVHATAGPGPTAPLPISPVTGQPIVDRLAVPVFDSDVLTRDQYETNYAVTVVVNSAADGWCYGHHGGTLVEYRCYDGADPGYDVSPKVADGTQIPDFQLTNDGLGFPIGSFVTLLAGATAEGPWWSVDVVAAMAHRPYVPPLVPTPPEIDFSPYVAPMQIGDGINKSFHTASWPAWAAAQARDLGLSAAVHRSYQWYSDGKMLRGQSSPILRNPLAYAGHWVSVKETASESGFETRQKTSTRVKLVADQITPVDDNRNCRNHRVCVDAGTDPKTHSVSVGASYLTWGTPWVVYRGSLTCNICFGSYEGGELIFDAVVSVYFYVHGKLRHAESSSNPNSDMTWSLPRGLRATDVRVKLVAKLAGYTTWTGFLPQH